MTATNRIRGESEVQIENDRLIVTKWTLAPEAETGWHRHKHDYMAVPLDDGELIIETPETVFCQSVERGGSYFRDAGAEHNVVNGSELTSYSFIEIEMKEGAGSERL